MDFKKLPKVALHDHLDGGLRPQTLLELADAEGIVLPANTAEALGTEIANRANSGSLVSYLETFKWTVGVMQKADNLVRIAREAVEDLAADGVVLAELRFAPFLHCEGGLRSEEIIEAVTEGLRQGQAATGMPVGLILCGIRSYNEFGLVSALFRREYGRNPFVVGVDLAGPELGFRPSRHPAIAQLAKDYPNAPITIHAGEADGVASIREALASGARRIGHGVRLIDDIRANGKLLDEMLDKNILIEICLSSNLQTATVDTIEHHPVKLFDELGIPVALCTDNRLMSATTHSHEYELAARTFGFSAEDLLRFTKNGIKASFLLDQHRAKAVSLADARQAA